MPWVGDRTIALLTDLYELTMAAAYFAEGRGGPATFELSLRSLPPERNFAVVAGIADVAEYLGGLRFDAEAIDYLDSLERFDRSFLRWLGRLRFTGEVWAVPEGTPVYPGEPLLRITAPLIEAQIVETLVLNTIGFQTMIASKAARVTLAAAGRPYADFGARRTHGADAALKGARAAYLAGAAATSLVLAGREYDIPVTGTMAHSYVLTHPSEADAFRSFARTFPDDAVLLIDTFDTLAGARTAAAVASELAEEGITVQGVRLDSGDLAALAHGVRSILDAAGFPQIRIFASGGLDEYGVRDLVATGAPIDAFGVGTRMVTSDDAPSLDVVYKLVADGAGPKMKTSTGKATLPGTKQVFRRNLDASPEGDVIALADEEGIEGQPLLRRLMAGGRIVDPPASLAEARRHCAEALAALPPRLRSLDPARRPAVSTSPGIDRLVATLSRERASAQGGETGSGSGSHGPEPWSTL
jgi:nicotinate phosphoribosyltransferase